MRCEDFHQPSSLWGNAGLCTPPCHCIWSMVLKLKFKYIIVCIIILVNHVFLIFFNISIFKSVRQRPVPISQAFSILGIPMEIISISVPVNHKISVIAHCMTRAVFHCDI